MTALFCTGDGGYGISWDIQSWGAFSNFADANGVSATDACCGCSGGTAAPPGPGTTVAPPTTPPPTVTAVVTTTQRSPTAPPPTLDPTAVPVCPTDRFTPLGGAVCAATCSTCSYPQEYRETACTSQSDAVCADVTACAPGEYLAAWSTPTSNTLCLPIGPCDSGQFLAPSGACQPYTVCDERQLLIAPPTTTTDRVCGEYTVCEAVTEYEFAAPTLSSDRDCQRCRVYSDDGAFFQAAPCEYAADTECEALTECDSVAQYESVAATATADRYCTDVTECTEQQFEERAPTANTDRTCARTTICSETEFELSRPTATTDRACRAWRPPCSSTEWESGPPSYVMDRYCSNCAVCDPSSEYTEAACGQYADTACGAITQCDWQTWYEIVPPTDTEDRVCGPITTCGQDQFESDPPTRTSDRRCEPYTVCAEGFFEAVLRTATTDRTCRAWTPPCDTDEWEHRRASTTADRGCSDCTACSSNEFAAVQCGMYADTVCHRVTECDSTTEFEAAPPTVDVDRNCQRIRICALSEFQDAAPTPTSDRGCATTLPCAEGYFEIAAPTETSNRRCEPWRSPCAANQWESGRPSAISNRYCSNCAPCSGAEYVEAACSAASNTVCSRYTECDWLQTEFEFSGSTTTSDRQCATITECPTTGQGGVGTGWFESQSPTRSSDRSCTEVSICMEGNFEVVAPTATSDRDCVPWGDPCGGHHWESRSPSPTNDRECSPCSPCSPSEWEFAACDGGRDTRCYNISSCDGPSTCMVTPEEQPCPVTDADIIVGVDGSGSSRDAFEASKLFAIKLLSYLNDRSQSGGRSVARMSVFTFSERWSVTYVVGGSSTGKAFCTGSETGSSASPWGCMSASAMISAVRGLQWPFNHGTQIGAMLGTNLAGPLQDRLRQRLTSVVLITDGDPGEHESDEQFEQGLAALQARMGGASANLCFRNVVPGSSRHINWDRLRALADPRMTRGCGFNRAGYSPSSSTTPWDPYFRFETGNAGLGSPSESTVVTEATRFVTDGRRGLGPLLDCEDCQDRPLYQETPATLYSDAVCPETSVCRPDDQYTVQEATQTSDTVCADLTECDADQYMTTRSTATTDRRCTNYRTACAAADWYFRSPGTTTSDRICQPCTSCPMDQFRLSVCTTDANTRCQDISACLPTTEYQAAEPTETSNRVCVPIGTCAPGEEFELAPPTDFRDRQCQLLRECGYEEFESIAPTATSNRVCAPNTWCNPAYKFETAAPTNFTDRECGELTVCGAATEWISTRKTPTSDRNCSTIDDCNFEGLRTMYETVAPTRYSNRECASLTVCEIWEYEPIAPTAISNRVCRNLTTCLATEYESRAPTPSVNRACEAVGDCHPGQFVLTNATELSNVVCEECTRECTIPPTDLVFMVDASGSVDSTVYGGIPGSYRQGNAFLAELVGQLPDLSAAELRVAAITFSTNAQIAFDFLTHGSDKDGIMQALVALPYEGQLTRTDLAIAQLRQLMALGRSGVRTVVVIITSGPSTNAIALQMQLRFVRSSVIRYVIGVGSAVDATELVQLAGGQASNVFTHTSYAAFESDSSGLAARLSGRVCSSLCPDGQYENAPCSEHHDRACLGLIPCSDPEEYEFTPPSAFADRVCRLITDCETDQYEAEPPTRTSNRRCLDVTTECQPGSFMATAATPTNNSVCQEWRQCRPNFEYEDTPPLVLADRRCAPVTCCTCLGQAGYETIAPSPTSDRLCDAITQCSLGVTFESVPPTATSDRTCTNVSTCPAASSFVVAAPTLEDDRVCQELRTCDTLTGLPAESGAPGEYVSRVATSLTDRDCDALTVCEDGTYISIHATETTDRDCANCDRTCESTAMDLIFIVDSSASVNLPQYGGQDGNYERGNQFLAALVDELPDLGENSVRVAAITFSTNAVTRFNLSMYGADKIAIMDALRGLPYDSGYTRTDRAINETRRLLTAPGHQPADRTVLVFLTDGRSNEPEALEAELDHLAQMTSVNVTERFAIGVGPGVTDDSELILLAGGDVENRVSTYNSYNEIRTAELSERILRVICTSLCPFGQFEVDSCGGTHNLVCGWYTNCTADQYESEAPTPTTDRGCSAVTSCQALPNTYTVAEATRFANTICAATTQCQPVGTEWESRAPTNSTDRVCNSTTQCSEEDEYELLEPTATSNRQCNACVRCLSPLQYRAEECSVVIDETSGDRTTSPGRCANSTICSLTEYESEPPSLTSNRVCSDLSAACDAGPPRLQYVRVAPTFTSDRNCGECSSCQSVPIAVDLVFLIDTSSSIDIPAYGGQNGNFDQVRRLGISIVQAINDDADGVGVAEDGVRVAAITFSTGASIAFDFGGSGSSDFSAEAKVDAFRNHLSYNEGRTDTADALALTMQELFANGQDHGFRNFRNPVVMVLLTDGRSSDPDAFTEQVRRLDELSDFGGRTVSRHAFGVGTRYNRDELEQFTRHPDRVRIVDTFSNISDWTSTIIDDTGVSACLICPAGTYMTSPCSAVEDRQCAPVTVCPHGHELIMSTPTSDAVCSFTPPSTSPTPFVDSGCPSNEFELIPPYEFTDRLCTPTSSCSTMQWELTAPTATTDRECSDCASHNCEFNNNIDLIFLLDGSFSISDEEFDTAKTLLEESVQLIPEVSQDTTRVAIIIFAGDAEVQLSFEESTSMRVVLDSIASLTQRAGATRTDLAFNAARTQLITQARPGVPVIIFVITDGQVTLPVLLEIELAALEQLDRPIIRFAFGVGDADLVEELEAIAGSPSRVEVVADRALGFARNRIFAELLCDACPEQQYLIASCNATSDHLCASWTVCDGVTQYEVVPGSRTSDRACAHRTVCGANQYVCTPASATSDLVCCAITECTDTEFELIPPTALTDGICAPIRGCAAIEWEVEAPTRSTDRICLPCSVHCAYSTDIDLVFLVDGSTSVSDDEFDDARTLLSQSVQLISNISQISTRVALVTFASDAQVQLSFADSNSEEDVLSRIDSLTRPTGATRTDLAFHATRTELITQARPGVPVIIFVITDGQATMPAFLGDELAELEQLGRQIIRFAFGIGSTVLTEELEAIAGSPDRVEVVIDRAAGFARNQIFSDLLCDACPYGHYLVQRCFATGDRICQAWSECNPDTQYEAIPGTTTSDRACTNQTVCGSSEYACTPATHVTDKMCCAVSPDCCSDACAEFEYGIELHRSLNAVADPALQQCLPIFPSCSDRFSQVDATASADRVCTFDGDCTIGNTVFDLIWVLDASGSVEANFSLMKTFSAESSARLPLGPNRVRVAALQFHDTAEVAFDFDTLDEQPIAAYSDLEYESTVVRELRSVVFVNENRPSNLVHALQVADEDVGLMGPGSVRRDGVPTRMIIITDGRVSNVDGDRQDLTRHLSSLRQKGVSIAVIAVGSDIDYRTINELASSPDLILRPSSFAALLTENFARLSAPIFDVCGAGFFVAANCSAGGPQVCQACSTCGEDRYERSRCSSFADTECAACSEDPCPGGGFESAPCTDSADRECSPCSSVACPGGTYTIDCTPESDIQCVRCDRSCPVGTFVVSPCNATHNIVCEPCHDCPVGLFEVRSCGRDGMDVECDACSVNCPDGQYEFLPCRRDADRLCDSCTDACAEDEYMQRPCSGNSDAVCSRCTSECPDDQFMVQPCTSNQDAICSGCSGTCPRRQYASVPCSGADDRVCTSCSVCPEGQFVAQACSELTDTVCESCTDACPDGQFESAACSLDADLQCDLCDECTSEFYAATECGGASNRICSRCDERCLQGQYEAARCTATTDRACEVCTACQPGKWCTPCADPNPWNDAVCDLCDVCSPWFQIETAPCTCSSPSVCRDCPACPAEYYQIEQCASLTLPPACARCTERCIPGRTFESVSCDGNTDRVCTTCAVPSIGQSLVAECTETADTVLADCPAECPEYLFRTEPGSCECSACSSCSDGDYEDAPCSGTANTVCAACTTCAADEVPQHACSESQDGVCVPLLDTYFFPRYSIVTRRIAASATRNFFAATEVECARSCYNAGASCAGFIWGVRDSATCLTLGEPWGYVGDDTSGLLPRELGYYYGMLAPNRAKTVVASPTSFDGSAGSAIESQDLPQVHRTFGFAVEFAQAPGTAGYLLAKTNGRGSVRYFSAYIPASQTSVSFYYTPATGSGIRTVRFNMLLAGQCSGGCLLQHTLYVLVDGRSITMALDHGESVRRELGSDPADWLLPDCPVQSVDCVLMVGARPPVAGGGRYPFTGIISKLMVYPTSANLTAMRLDSPAPQRPALGGSPRSLLFWTNATQSNAIPAAVFDVGAPFFRLDCTFTQTDNEGGYLYSKSDATGVHR